MSATLKEIAQRTGRSITTVSRALADYDDVSPETKSLVRRVAGELGYTPNLLAQRLQKRRSDTIGLILPTFGPRFADPFFSEFLAGVGNMAAEHGYDLLVSTQAPGDREMQVYRQKVQSRQVDGFVIVRTRRQDTRISYLEETGFPFVAFGRTENDLNFPFVDVDSIQGMRLIAEHLIGLGHCRLACLAPPSDLLFAEQRLNGLRQALTDHGLDIALCRCEGIMGGSSALSRFFTGAWTTSVTTFTRREAACRERQLLAESGSTLSSKQADLRY